MLPKNIKLSSAITQWGNVGGLVLGFTLNDNKLISRSMNDVIIEPVRSNLIEGFDHIKKNALALGAIGCSISGSGPTIFALCENEDIAQGILNFSKSFYKSLDMGCDTFLSQVNNIGPIII